MNIAIASQSSDKATVVCEGRFDAYEAPKFLDVIDSLFKKNVFTILVNLCDTIFVDSTALASLVDSMKKAREQGGDVALGFPSEPVMVILELTALDTVFTIVEEQRVSTDTLSSTESIR